MYLNFKFYQEKIVVLVCFCCNQEMNFLNEICKVDDLFCSVEFIVVVQLIKVFFYVVVMLVFLMGNFFIVVVVCKNG